MYPVRGVYPTFRTTQKNDGQSLWQHGDEEKIGETLVLGELSVKRKVKMWTLKHCQY